MQAHEQIELTISDRGCGFTPAPIADLALNGPSADGPHFGLRGIRERVTALNGTLEVQSAAGAGTVLRVRVPYAPVVT